MQRLTVTERTEKRPLTIRSRNVGRDCRLMVNSMPKDVLLRTMFTEHRHQPMSKPLKKSGSSQSPALRERYNSQRQGRSTNRARIVHPGTRHCPGTLAFSSLDRTTCPGRQCQDNRRTECCPVSRIQSDQGTELCPGSRETSQTDWNIMMWNPSARVMTRDPSPRRMHQKLLSTPTSRRLRFIPC